jgi:hypothetical protein
MVNFTVLQSLFRAKFSDFHIGECSDFVLGCDAVYEGKLLSLWLYKEKNELWD